MSSLGLAREHHLQAGSAPADVEKIWVPGRAERARSRPKRLPDQPPVRQANAQPGGVYEVTLTNSLITTVTPKASSSVHYDYYDAINQQGDFLFMKVRGARIRAIVPRQLYSDEALQFLRSRIAR